MSIGAFFTRVGNGAVAMANAHLPEIRVAMSVVALGVDTYLTYTWKRHSAISSREKLTLGEMKGRVTFVEVMVPFVDPNRHYLYFPVVAGNILLHVLEQRLWERAMAKLISTVTIGWYVARKWGDLAGVCAGLVAGGVCYLNEQAYREILRRPVTRVATKSKSLPNRQH